MPSLSILDSQLMASSSGVAAGGEGQTGQLPTPYSSLS